MDCWEYKNCGRQGGGERAAELGVCPAWPHHGQDCARLARQGGQGGEDGEGGPDACPTCGHYQRTLLSQHAGRLGRDLVDLCPICIMGVNRAGVITMFNRAAEALLGHPAAAMLEGRGVAEVYADPADARRVKKTMHGGDYGPPDRLEDYPLYLRHRDGSLIPVRLWGFLLVERGVEVGSVGFFYDLRAERAAQDARVAREKMAAVLQLAGALLHNLAQPLQVLLADSGQLLAETGADHPMRESLEAIHASARDLSQLLEKVRRISRLESAAYSAAGRILDLDRTG